MKIAIVTVYSSKNFGSYWQSRTLCDYLKSLGDEVSFLDTKARNTFFRITKPILISVLKSLIKGKINKAKFELNVLKIFKNNLSKLNIVDSSTVLSKYDCMVFGSDEIWNVTRDDMIKFPVFWGVGFDGIKKISYAPSINEASLEDMKKCNFGDALSSFAHVSVRDKYSVGEVSKVYNGNVELVIDPTFLVNKDYYDQIPYDAIDYPYIAVYMFCVSDEQYAYLRKVADLLGKKLVRVGNYDERFDRSVLAENPFIYYKDADYVIANTFHGIAYAINFGKQLIALNNNYLPKIDELLEQFGLSDRNMVEKSAEETVRYVTENPIDWSIKSQMVDELRRNSRSYLENAINQ